MILVEKSLLKNKKKIITEPLQISSKLLHFDHVHACFLTLSKL